MDIYTLLSWCAAVGIGGFSAGVGFCKYMTPRYDVLEANCDISDDKHNEAIATVIAFGRPLKEIKISPKIKISTKNHKPYHCDCTHFEPTKKQCRLNGLKCKML